MTKKTRCRLKIVLLISVVYCSDTLSCIRSHFHFTSIANAMWTDFKLPYYPLKIKRSSQFELQYDQINLFANFAMLFILRYKYILRGPFCKITAMLRRKCFERDTL